MKRGSRQYYYIIYYTLLYYIYIIIKVLRWKVSTVPSPFIIFWAIVDKSQNLKNDFAAQMEFNKRKDIIL